MFTTPEITTRPYRPWPLVAGIRVMDRNSVYWLFERMRPDGRLTVGRTRQREIQVDDPSVSRRHCEIIHQGGGRFVLRALGSINPVAVSYRSGYDGWYEVDEVTLQPGLYIKLGEAVIIPVDPDGGCPITAMNDAELARKAEKVYGNASEAQRRIGRSRQWIRKMTLTAKKVLL